MGNRLYISTYDNIPLTYRERMVLTHTVQDAITAAYAVMREDFGEPFYRRLPTDVKRRVTIQQLNEIVHSILTHRGY